MTTRLLSAVAALAEHPGDVESVLAAAREHRVDLLLIREALHDGSSLASLPTAHLRAMVREAATAELARTGVLRRVLAAWGDAGISPILLKGESLARTLYPEPYLRRRLDADVLVSPAARTTAESTLATLGFERMLETEGDVWSSQSHWRLTTHGVPVAIDLHWRPFNAVAFADVLSFDRIDADAQPLDGLPARMPSLEHQLLLAAMHRVVHHYDTPNLLWIYDLHLLAGALGGAGLARVATFAMEQRVGPILARGLRRAVDALGTPVDADLLVALERSPLGPAMAPFLQRPSGLGLIWSDVRSVTTWQGRLRLARSHLLPPVSYMRQRYPRTPAWALPLAYVDRVVRGLPKWIRPA